MQHQIAAGSEFGNYHIVRPIGGGGMAQIYLAKTEGLAGFEKYLALKVINPEYATEERFIQMLIDEAKITVGLSHVNICQVFDLGQVEGIYYISMEFVDGMDVLELVNGLHALGERLPIEAVAYIGRQICSGLHYAHSRKNKQGEPLNIVHRDISPQNILVSRNGEVKVVDFGIAKAAGMSTKTQAGVIKGKVNYMAPEQAMGQKADRRTDIFATGIVMWEMLTSQMVYNGNNVGELVAAVRKADIKAPSTVRPEIPPQLDTIVAKALHAKAEERYQTAHELQVDLTKFLSATAPDYSGSHLSALVERVIAKEPAKPVEGEVEDHLSRDDLEQIPDRNSLIFEIEDSSVARLLVKTDQGEKLIELGDELIIGRAGQLAIADARVSRQHARILKQGAGFFLEDLGSSNGTFVNDVRVTSPQMLKPHDRIGIGSASLTFLPPGGGRKSPQPRAEMPVPKLIISNGGETMEQSLAEDAELTYRIQIGPVRLQGVSGHIKRKNDGYWLEPNNGRVKIQFKGRAASSPVRLTVGDSFEVAGVTFRLTHETQPFDSVSRPKHS
ncbi:MAG: protein kinase [Myxococcales bacterium]|nr:protein kinase [Myxococcales bacterium]